MIYKPRLTGRFVDFSLLADDWLDYASDIQPGSAIQTGSAQKKEGAGKKVVPAWTSAVSGAIGNAFSRSAIAPLERVRMSMITDPCEQPPLVLHPLLVLHLPILHLQLPLHWLLLPARPLQPPVSWLIMFVGCSEVSQLLALHH